MRGKYDPIFRSQKSPNEEIELTIKFDIFHFMVMTEKLAIFKTAYDAVISIRKIRPFGFFFTVFWPILRGVICEITDVKPDKFVCKPLQ